MDLGILILLETDDETQIRLYTEYITQDGFMDALNAQFSALFGSGGNGNSLQALSLDESSIVVTYEFWPLLCELGMRVLSWCAGTA